MRWLILSAASACAIAVFTLLRLPGAFLLGAMVGGIVLASVREAVRLPAVVSAAAMALVGCLIGRVITRATLSLMASHWPVFIVSVLSVIACAALVGWLLARWRVLPGTTAIWGAFPGAASVMTFMSESYGADVRLVALMQYTRVAMVTTVASGVARFFGAATGVATQPMFGPVHWPEFGIALVLAGTGVLFGERSGIPAGPLLIPFVLTSLVINVSSWQVELPRWLLASAYVVLGWNIGLRFTRETVSAAARAWPRVILAILVVIGVCGALAVGLSTFAEVDGLTAYLAMSPGGVDTAAIIGASADVDLAFIMSMQTARFLVVLLIGPRLAAWLARHA